MTDAEARLFAMNTAITAALRVALATHPNRKQVIQALRNVSEQTEAFFLGQPMSEASLDASRSVFASLIQSLEND